MAVHVVLLILIIINWEIIIHSTIENKKKCFIIVSLLLIAFVQGLRAYTVGADTRAYYYAFETMQYQNIWEIHGWEHGYLLLNKIVGLFSDNPQVLIFSSSMLIQIGFGLFFYKTCDDEESAFWSIFLFMCFLHYANSLNLMRQYLAMATGIQVYWVMRDLTGLKRWVISVILIALAVSFHSAAIILIFLFLPYIFKRIDFGFLFITGLGIIAIVYFFDSFLSVGFRLLPQYVKYQSSYRLAGEELGGFYLIYSLFKIILVIIALIVTDKTNDEETMRIAFLVLVSAGLLILKTKTSLAMRTGYYFDVFTLIFVPRVINRCEKTRTILYFLVLIYAVLFFFHTIGSVERAAVPYLFFWEI